MKSRMKTLKNYCNNFRRTIYQLFGDSAKVFKTNLFSSSWRTNKSKNKVNSLSQQFNKVKYQLNNLVRQLYKIKYKISSSYDKCMK